MSPAPAMFWDNIAERYAAKPVEDVPAYQEKLKATRARLDADDRVLDLGCGTGSLALELAPHVREVHSVDISKEMIRIGREKVAAAGVDNITFHQAVLDQPLPFEAGSFDMVCAYNILHLVDDMDGVLRQAFSLCRPGGHFVASTVVLGNSLVPYMVLITLMRLVGKAPKVRKLNSAQLHEAVTNAGFEDLRALNVTKEKIVDFCLARRPA